MALTAADVMQTHLITVSPSDPLDAVRRLFYEEEIHGAPVVDEDGRVQGMITSMEATALARFSTVRSSPAAMWHESKGPRTASPVSVVTVISPSSTT